MNELLKNAKPILFNTEMVKAILDGRKTQIRRIIKKEKICEEWIMKRQAFKDTHSKYKVDDILYVRETFIIGLPDGTEQECENNPLTVFYRADDTVKDWIDWGGENINIPWKPSIHMPKKYARIFLKVTNVRVERLQDIRLDDVYAEGFIPEYSDRYGLSSFQWFEKIIWNSTAKQGYKWEDNPYVFVYEFERVQ